MSAPLLTDQAGPPTTSPARRRAGLLVLATTTFVVVTTELLPVGLLTTISDDLGVARSRVGLLVTVYAFTVGLTAAPLTHWTAGWPRKRLYLSYRRAEEIFEENTRLLANPLASPDDIVDLDGWTLHRLRHSALTHDAEDGTSTPMLLARSRHASVRSLERYARPGVDSVARHLAERDPAARRRT